MFHVTMRITVLRQYAKVLAGCHHDRDEAEGIDRSLARIEGFLWHCNLHAALPCIHDLAMKPRMHRDRVPEHRCLPARRPRVPDRHCQQRPYSSKLRRAPSLRGAGLDRLRRIHGQHGGGKALCEEAADALAEGGNAPPSDQDPHARRHAQDQVPILASRALQRGKHGSGDWTVGRLTPRILVIPIFGRVVGARNRDTCRHAVPLPPFCQTQNSGRLGRSRARSRSEPQKTSALFASLHSVGLA